MTVSELIKLLESFDGKTRVMLATDSEGNSFGLAYDTVEGFYHQGEVRSKYDLNEDQLKECESVAVIWP